MVYEYFKNLCREAWTDGYIYHYTDRSTNKSENKKSTRNENRRNMFPNCIPEARSFLFFKVKEIEVKNLETSS